MKTIQETCNKKAHKHNNRNTQSHRNPKDNILTGQLIEKERIIVMIVQELNMEE